MESNICETMLNKTYTLSKDLGDQCQYQTLSSNCELDQTNFDVDNFYLEASSTEYPLDVSLRRCTPSIPNQYCTKFDYSPPVYEPYSSPKNFYKYETNFESTIETMNDSRFMSNSCLLYATNPNINFNSTTLDDYHLPAFPKPSALIDLSIEETSEECTSRGAECCQENCQTEEFVTECDEFTNGTETQLNTDQSSAFKRNQTGRISCNNLYNYLIKPIRNKIKCAKNFIKKPTGSDKRVEEANGAAKPIVQVKPGVNHLSPAKLYSNQRCKYEEQIRKAKQQRSNMGNNFQPTEAQRLMYNSPITVNKFKHEFVNYGDLVYYYV